MKRLRKRRVAVIDRFLDEGFATAIPRIAELLAYGSATAVQQHFLKAEETGGAAILAALSDVIRDLPRKPSSTNSQT